jgi:uncharacterized membrane-anchored protein YhcB (DUF1043 family)
VDSQVLWILITLGIIAGIVAGLYFWGKRLQKKYDEQQQVINQTKQAVTLFVIDKKKDKPDNLKLPKQVKEQLPKLYKRRKMPVIIAKIGPQIQTLLCDEAIYQSIPIKKQIKVELAGILVVKVLSGKLPQPKKQSLLDKAKSKFTKTN